MNDNSRKKEDLIREISDLRLRIKELEQSEKDLRKTKEALNKSEEMFRKVFYTSPDTVGINRLEDGMFVSINPAFTRYTGYTEEDVIGKTSVECNIWVNVEDRQRFVEGLKRDGEVLNLEAPFRTKYGEIRFLLMSASMIDLGGVPHLLCITRDITEHKRAEEALRESEDRYRSLVDNCIDAVLLTAPDGSALEANPGACRIFARTEEEICRAGRAGLVDLTDPRLAEALQERERTGQFRGELTFLRKNGTPFPGEVSSAIFKDRNGNSRTSMFIRDITERKQAEEERQKLASVVQYSSELVSLATLDGRMIFLNEAGSKMLGIDPAELSQHPIMEVIPEQWRGMVQSELLPDVMEKGRWEGDLQYRNIRTDAVTDVHALAFMIKDAKTGAPLYLANVSLDITERKRAEESLRKANETLRALFDYAPLSIVMLDLQSRVMLWNKASETMYGWTAQEVLGEVIPFVPEEKREEMRGLREHVTQGGILTGIELEGRRKDGSRILGSTSIAPLRDATGRVYAHIGIAADITERKQAEEALSQETALLEAQLNSSIDGIMVIDNRGRKILQNRRAVELLKIPKEIADNPDGQMQVNYVMRLTRDPDRFVGQIKYLYSHPDETSRDEIELKDGRVLDRYSAPVIGSDGRNYGRIWSFRDITERKSAENALKESEEKYRELVRYAPAGIYEVDYETNRFTGVNDVICEYTGYTRDELSTMNLFSLLTEESQKLMLGRLEKLVAGEEVGNAVEYCIRTKGGDLLWCLLNARYIYEAGKLKGATGVVHNVTERRRVETALRLSEENFRRSLDDSPLGVRIVSIEGETIYANRAVLDIYGYGGVEELRNTPVKDRYAPQSYEEFKTRMEERKSGNGPSKYEISIVRKNGEIRHLQVFRGDILWNGERRFQTIYQDITKRKRAEEELHRMLESLREAIGTTIQVMVSAVEARDPYTAGHQLRSTNLARAIATEMGLHHEKIEGVRMAGSIHDIGKLYIPAEILSKPSKLTALEFALIKEHSQKGYEILKNVESSWPLAEIVYQHHERMDGSGYPRKLKGDDILMEARILAVADVVESMASHRPYRAALGLDAALEEIEKNRGVLYDPEVVDVCLKLFRGKGFHL